MRNPRPTTVETSSHILSALKTPDLRAQSSPCEDVSLADSSITTTEEGTTCILPSITSTQATSKSSSSKAACDTSNTALSPTTGPAGAVAPTTAASTYQPRSLRDLVRHDLRSTDPRIVQRALQQITLDCWDDANARSLVARAGGILSICNILEDFQGQHSIELAACQALTKLSLDSDNELAVAELGGVELLWKLATTTENMDPRVTEAAWAALQNCTCQSSSDWHPNMQAWVHILQKNTNPVVAGHVSAATANLCVASPARAQAFGQTGGIVAMAQALEQHWHDESVRTDVAQSLGRVCMSLAHPDK
jgi:hypothetical protein